MTRRRAALLAVCLLAIAALLWWWRRAPPPGAAGPADAPPPLAAAARPTATSPVGAPPPPTPPTAASGTPASTLAAAAAPTAAAGDDEGLPRQPQVVALAAQAADEYRTLAQYPPWSRPFGEEGADPILRDREVSPISAAGPEGEEPILVVFPDQVGFEAPDPVLLYAYLLRGGERVPADAVTGTLMTETLHPLGEFAYRDDGRAGDAMAGDLIYSARLQLDDSMLPELSDAFMVRVRAVAGDAERIAAGGFLYSNPHAQLTGRYRDAIVDGNLALDAEVEVLQPGRFHLEGTLYDRDGSQGLAEAQTAAELPSGLHWLRLTFFGRILHQQGVDGPYLLRFLALSTTSAMPNAKNRLVENAHVTGAYRAAQFSNAPYDDPDLLDAADRLERTLEERD